MKNVNVPENGPVKIRTQNKFHVLNTIRQHDLSSRAEVAELTEMTKATISEIVVQLITEGLVVESQQTKNEAKAGRKGVALSFNKQADHAIAIDLGGTKITLSLFNIGLERLTKKTVATFKTTDRQTFISSLNQEIKTFIKECAIGSINISIIGIATAGIVNHTTGYILGGSPNLPQWEGFSIANEITAALNIPVVVENDVRAALVGELYAGKCQQIRNAMLIGIGTGLGSALVIDGKLIRGTHNAAGEIGYMVLSREQLNQNWYNKGALESHCSGSGIEQRYRHLTGQQLLAKDIFHLATSGNYTALSVIEELSDSLALGVINAITLANPEKVVLYGGICAAAPHFLTRTQALIDRHTLANTKVTLELSDMGDDAPIYGMAVIAMTSAHPSIQFLPNIQL